MSEENKNTMRQSVIKFIEKRVEELSRDIAKERDLAIKITMQATYRMNVAFLKDLIKREEAEKLRPDKI